MRKKPLILVTFLLMLYISPMFLIASYGSATIPTQQNTSKDFVLTSDPWLNGWNNRKSINLTGSAGAGRNYQVNITVERIGGEMQTDFDDIRFTDNDGVTLLDYWLEDRKSIIEGAPFLAWFWVEVKDNLDTTQEIYMYYNNTAVSTTSNGANTFLFYDDWTAESMNGARWTTLSSDGSVSWDSTDANHGSVLKVEGAAGANSQAYESAVDTTAPHALMFRANIEQTLAANQRVRVGSGSPTIFSFAYIEGNAATLRLTVYDDDANADHQTMDAAHFGAYHTFQITRDGTNAKLYIDGALDETASCDPDIISTPITSMFVEDSEKDLYLDWVCTRKYITVEPVFFSFGDEETYTPLEEEWVEVGEAELIFFIPVFTGSLDAILIFLGLAMIPLSILYLVKGGKDEMSSDKLFYVIIVFIMGWALFLGGIYG